MTALAFAVVPGFDRLQHIVALQPRGPQRFVLLQADFIIPLALAFVIAAEVGHVRDPHDAIYGDVFVIDQNKNRCGSHYRRSKFPFAQF
jgi:hypothetical protein